MTSAHVNVIGHPGIRSATPSDTNEATLFTANDDSSYVVAVWLTNLTGSNANATVKWGDGSTDYSLIDTYAVTARMFERIPCLIPLRNGYTIKVTSSTGSALTFTAIVVEGGTAFGSRVV